MGLSLSQRTVDAKQDKARFREVVARIHGTLVIAPSVPKVLPQASQSSLSEAANGSANAAEEPVSTAQAVEDVIGTEIPFVPAAQRQAVESGVVDDSIVVVGQARQKKRKRGAKGSKGKEITEDTGNAEQEDIEPFDYSSVSNILDEGFEPEQEEPSYRKKKQRHVKGTYRNNLTCYYYEVTLVQAGAAAYQYGNFPAPPKAHSQLKSGNQSRTFR